MKKKILLLFGTRPEAIKMAPLCKLLKRQKNIYTTKICVTGQHREMLDQVLTFFGIVPDYDLNLMRANQTLNELSSRLLRSLDSVLEDFNPGLVLVHGDTSTSSMGALAAFHRGIMVGHVEAGLRTFDTLAPFPEEMNRQLTGKIASLHFTPTQKAFDNLVISENVSSKNVFMTGNTVIDALMWGIKHVNTERDEIKRIQSFRDSSKKLIVVTGHRRENFGKKFECFCNALSIISKRADVQIIYPVHLNPNVYDTVHGILANNSNILLLEPLDYEVFIWLLKESYLIITDSGGIQEEAPSLGKPVLVTRDVTERQEAVEKGTAMLVGTEIDKIVNKTLSLLDDQKIYDEMSSTFNPYGDGKASKRILNIILKILS
jgi:UDP-N-acetylglucosamine 2-epimerase (non-hydrolysing)